MGIDEIFEISGSRSPEWEELAACCSALGGEIDDALNVIALTLAERYDAGLLQFHTCDTLVNAMHGWCLLSRDRLLPQPARQVFLAFDEGEYHHPLDTPGVDAEAKYTRPMIKE